MYLRFEYNIVRLLPMFAKGVVAGVWLVVVAGVQGSRQLSGEREAR